MRRHMSVIRLISSISMLGCLLAFETSAEIVDRIVAVVNTTAITDFQVRKAQQDFEQDGAPDEVLGREAVLNFLIEQELVLQEAGNLGILVTDEELRSALDNIKQQNNLASDEQLKTALAREGKTLTEFQDEVRQQIRLAKIVSQEVRSKVTVSNAEVDAYYDAHRAEFEASASANGILVRQILLPVPEKATTAQIEQIRQEADTLIQQLRAGADFADLARAHSQHSSAASGGELGIFHPGELAEPFDVAFTLQADAVSDPIRTDQGFHIITAQPAGDNGQDDILQIKSQIRNALFEEKSQQQYNTWIETLKENAYIDMK